MELLLIEKEYCWNEKPIQLFLPEPQAVLQEYQKRKRVGEDVPFPYWTQVWPASLALSQFLSKNPQYTNEKNVLELAAGLGLPSFVAAQNAASVLCTDYLTEAVEIINVSIAANRLNNTKAAVLNWRDLPANLHPDVLLLSDINYEPSEFSVLKEMLLQFIKKGTTILLSTPQRLMAKSFIADILQWCIQQEMINVAMQEPEVMISVYVLKGNN